MTRVSSWAAFLILAVGVMAGYVKFLRPPALPAYTSGIELLRVVKKELLSASTVQIQGTTVSTFQGESATTPIHIAFGEGKKFRLEVTPMNSDGPFIIVSDGRRVSGKAHPSLEPVTSDLTKDVRVPYLKALCTKGVLSHIRTFDADGLGESQEKEEYTIEIALGDRDTTEGRAIQKIEFFSKDSEGKPGPFSVTVWVDLERRLPIKREMREAGEGYPVLVETYSDFRINARIPPETFKLPVD